MSKPDSFTNGKMTVLITGAAGGLGKAFVVECASRGWDLFITDLHIEPLDTLANHIRHVYGVKIHTYACDLADSEERSRLMETVCSQQTKFTALINVAGVDYAGGFLDQNIQSIEHILRLNIEAGVALIHRVPGFRCPDILFRIINVASMAAFYPMPMKATYAASKRFLLDFSRALREELRPLNATVTVLCPAGMPTKPDTIQAIYAQGLGGFLTTMDVGRVVFQTINAALVGKSVVIPGALNRFICSVSSFLPPALLAKLIYLRWSDVRKKRHLESVINEQPSYQKAQFHP